MPRENVYMDPNSLDVEILMSSEQLENYDGRRSLEYQVESALVVTSATYSSS